MTTLLIAAASLAAQPADNTHLKQVIVFSRHGVRAPTTPNSILNTYASRPYPGFGVAPGLVTPNGAAVETILGGYYRLWLTQQGLLLTGNDAADAAYVYLRPNVAETATKPTAQAFASGFLPGANVNLTVISTTQRPDLRSSGRGRRAARSAEGDRGDNGTRRRQPTVFVLRLRRGVRPHAFGSVWLYGRLGSDDGFLTCDYYGSVHVVDANSDGVRVLERIVRAPDHQYVG